MCEAFDEHAADAPRRSRRAPACERNVMLYDSFIVPLPSSSSCGVRSPACCAGARAGPIACSDACAACPLVATRWPTPSCPARRSASCSPGSALFAMTAGGLIAGFVVALLTGFLWRATTELRRGCRARHLLSAVARGRRHHRLAQGHQHRSAARAVRHVLALDETRPCC